MTVRFRSSLSELPAYVPGRTIAGAVKLASNESAYPPLPFVVDEIARVAASANRYPDNAAAELTAALADWLGVAADRVVPGCGSVSLCQQLVLATAGVGDEVLYAWRSFEAYPIITLLAGATPVQVPLNDEVHDLDAMAAAITGRTRTIFICNPNNPTGTVVAHEDLVAFLDRVPPEVLVVIDEAYHEFATDPAVTDAVALLDRYPNLIVLRTFSKAYGLAGLRIGYGIAADPAVAAAARSTQAPFALTSVGQAAAIASLQPAAQSQMRERVAEVETERSRVTKALRELGYAVPPTMANFAWLKHAPASEGGVDAVAFAEQCERRKVIVRCFAGWGVRVSFGSPSENDAFLDGLPPLGGE